MPYVVIDEDGTARTVPYPDEIEQRPRAPFAERAREATRLATEKANDL